MKDDKSVHSVCLTSWDLRPCQAELSLCSACYCVFLTSCVFRLAVLLWPCEGGLDNVVRWFLLWDAPSGNHLQPGNTAIRPSFTYLPQGLYENIPQCSHLLFIIMHKASIVMVCCILVYLPIGIPNLWVTKLLSNPRCASISRFFFFFSVWSSSGAPVRWRTKTHRETLLH